MRPSRSSGANGAAPGVAAEHQRAARRAALELGHDVGPPRRHDLRAHGQAHALQGRRQGARNRLLPRRAEDEGGIDRIDGDQILEELKGLVHHFIGE